MITADRLSLRLGTTQVLRSVSLQVDEGEVVSVMGPSGSGKSTLLHVLAGILRPDQGEVHLDGRRLDNVREGRRGRARLEQMGFVFQFGDVVPELTMLENVMLPLQLLGLPTRAARSRAPEVMTELGVEDVAGDTLGTVSGGQSQRVAVARALVHRPRVLFADEPTGALDTLCGERVMDALTSAAEQRGTTVVLVTHDAKVASYAHRNITLRDGRVTSPPWSRRERGRPPGASARAARWSNARSRGDHLLLTGCAPAPALRGAPGLARRQPDGPVRAAGAHSRREPAGDRSGRQRVPTQLGDP